MAKLITLTFAIVGLAVGFFGGISIASALKPNQSADVKLLVMIFGGAVLSAVLFRSVAAAARNRLDPRYWPALGSIGGVLAFASLVVLFGSIS